mgnify:CR=1 FL=1
MKGSLCRLAETSFLWRDTAMRIRERFNPRAPCGARPPTGRAATGAVRFQPTRPLRGATGKPIMDVPPGVLFQPTRPLRGATNELCFIAAAHGGFQPTRPARGATGRNDTMNNDLLFQPTRPLRGATRRHYRRGRRYGNFNPRAPCGARHQGRLTGSLL